MAGKAAQLGEVLTKLRIPQMVRLAEISVAEGVYQAVAIGGLAGIDALDAETAFLALVERQDAACDTADLALSIHDEAITRLRAQETASDVMEWAKGVGGQKITAGGLKVILRSAWLAMKGTPDGN